MSIVAIPAQLDNFSLSGAGSSIGDTVLNLKSFKDILSVNLTMTSFGSIGYGTIEPGNGVQEEQISFSGITQNSDGTAQLTGVKHVLFISPFTETSGMTITHPGSVVFIITNTSGFENAIYTYINNAIALGGVPATASQQGITTLTVNPDVAGSPIAVGNNDTRIQYTSSVLLSGIPYANGGGTAAAFTATLASSLATLASGSALNFMVPTTNASGVTLNVNAIGAKPIKKNYNVALASGDVVAGQIVDVVYDGANFQLNSPVVSTGWQQIAESILGVDSISFTISGIPARLDLRVIIDSPGSSTGGLNGAYLNFNSDLGANYAAKTYTDRGAVVATGGDLSIRILPNVGNTNGWYSVSDIRNTLTSSKTVFTTALESPNSTTNGQLLESYAHWNNTAAQITSILVSSTTPSTGKLLAGTRITVYGR